MPQPNDLSRSLTALDRDSAPIAVLEMSQASWLGGAIVPGIERHPLKKLAPDPEELLRLRLRWRGGAIEAGRATPRITVAFEVGRDGFWLARWLRTRSIEASVIHASSVALSREHRRAKTDRLDVELLKRAFLGWLRGRITVSFRPAIPRRVAPQQSPPPLRRPRQCKSIDHSGTINAGQPVLIFLSHPWGAVQRCSLFLLFFAANYQLLALGFRRESRPFGFRGCERTATRALFRRCFPLFLR